MLQVVLDLLDQNIILHVLMINSGIAVPAEVLVPFLSFSDNLLRCGRVVFRKKRVDSFEMARKNMLNFSLGCSSTSTVRANYRIRYGTKSGTSVPDPVHPIPQCIGQTQIFQISN